MTTVRLVTGDKKGMNDFINLPYSLYKNDKNWCPPLKLERKRFFSSKNPFMLHSNVAFFVAYRGSAPVGRVTAHIDDIYNSYYDARQGFFGFFESIDSIDVAEKLMSSAEDWLKNRDIDSIIGPCNFSTNHEVGFLTKGFDLPPLIMMTYTKRFYPALLGRLGYKKEKELLAYWLDNITNVPEIVNNASKLISEKSSGSITIRNLDMKRMDSDLKVVLDIYNRAWSKNWGFVPMTDKEIKETAKELKFIANPHISFILYKDETPAAVLVGLPDINQALIRIKNGRLFPSGIFKLLFSRKHINHMRVCIMGVKEEFRKQGLDLLLINKIFREGLEKTPFRGVEMSWILEDNILMNRLLERLNANPYKRYIILKKVLEAG